EEADKRKNKGFYNLLTALYETGARPGEVRLIEAKNYNPKLVAWVIDSRPDRQRGGNKLAHHGKRRVIFLTPKVQGLGEKLNREFSEGPIFRNEKGRAVSHHSLALRMKRYQKAAEERLAKQGKPSPFKGSLLVPYSYRHKFVTDWLLAGKSIAYLAELLG